MQPYALLISGVTRLIAPAQTARAESACCNCGFLPGPLQLMPFSCGGGIAPRRITGQPDRGAQGIESTGRRS